MTEQGLTANGTGYWYLSARKGKEDQTGADLARNLTAVAVAREIADIPRRYRNLLFFRHFTGRPVIGSYAFGMARRPPNFISFYQEGEFSPPRYNLIGTCADIYVTRLLVHQTYVEMVPDGGPQGFGQRQVSMDVEDWIEGGFEQTGYTEVRKAMGIDALCYGSGFLKWAESFDGKNIDVTAPPPDELLFANYDDPDPREYIQRVWADREDVLDRYGTTDEARDAIIHCPEANPAFFFGQGQLATKQVIPLLYGLRASHANGKPGREVLVVGNYTVYDRDWKDADTNLIKYDFNEAPSSLFGQGISELLLDINEEIDAQLAVEQESFIRSGSGKWFYDSAGDINPDALGDTVAAAISVAPGSKYPEYVTPDPITERSGERIDRLIKLGMKRVHISENAIAGDVPKALTSAPALESWAKIDDVNFAEKIERLEKVDLKSAYQMIRLAKKIKPSYTRTGSTLQIINWDKLKIDRETIVGLKGFNVGRLGQTISGKQQTLTAMLAAGTIQRDDYNKYLQVPNTQALLDQLNAPETGVDDALDELVLADEYIPPVSFLNLTYAKQAAEARYILEKKRGLPEEQLDFILQWRASVIELLKKQTAGFSPAALPATAPGAPAGTDKTIPGPPVPIPQQQAQAA